LALVLIAFAWVYKAGIYPGTVIHLKFRGCDRRMMSLFRYGFVYIANLHFSNDIDKLNHCGRFLLYT